MRTRLFIISAAFLFLVAGGLLAFAIPARAQAEYCERARVVDLHAEVHHTDLETPGYVVLYWSYDISPWPKDLYLDEVAFRVDRRNAKGGEWETVGTVVIDYTWTGPTDPGQWIYRVSLVSLHTSEGTELCSNVAAETAVDLPSESELTQNLLGQLCQASEVNYLLAVRPEDGSLMLKWEDELDHYYEEDWHHLRGDNTPTFRADAVIYRVGRSSVVPGGSEDGWTTLAETEERTWTGPAEPGRWVYRVGTVRMTKGSISQDCDPWYAEEYVSIQTEEEAAEQERQSKILQAEATRCATQTLTSGLRNEAWEIVANYTAERVAEAVAESADPNDPEATFNSLVTLTVLLCAEESPPLGYGVSTGPVWGTLMLLDISGWDW